MNIIGLVLGWIAAPILLLIFLYIARNGAEYDMHKRKYAAISNNNLRVISSGGTFLIKFIIPTLLIGASLFFLAIIIPVYLKSKIMGMVLIIPLLIIYLLKPFKLAAIKRVAIDDKSIFISNYIKTISIPITEIDNVKQVYIYMHWRQDNRYIVLRLLSDTAMGREIIFKPLLQEFIFNEDVHPLIAELISLRDDIRNNAQ
ncbi:MAG: hypothetical protein HZB61_13560 [Nitrospirae bacterium]|nr:hypothetical protein [Nitrospirota bacterium]